MALIKCEECGREVSNRAVTCPQCGNPIAAALDVNATGAALTTTQATAKKFKAHMLVATVISCIGVIMMVAAGPQSMAWGSFLLLIGIAIFLVARVRAWWHHG